MTAAIGAGSVTYAPRLTEGLKTALSHAGKAIIAINGLEQMEARFLRAVADARAARSGRTPGR